MTTAITATTMALRICLRRFFALASCGQAGSPSPPAGGLSSRWARPETLSARGRRVGSGGADRVPGVRPGPLTSRECPWSSRNSVEPRSATPTASGPWPITSPAPAGEGTDVVAVVSAMGKTTDDLIHLANSVSSVQPPREYDMLVSTGERISMSLLCMALAELGVDAASFTGSQVGHHHRQRPHPGQDPRGQGGPPARGPGRRKGPGGGRLPGRVDRPRDHDAGPRRLRRHRRRPGRRAGADACEIYTDVTGVFTADPRVVPDGPPDPPDLL